MILFGIVTFVNEVQSLKDAVSNIVTLTPLISDGITSSVAEPSYLVIAPSFSSK